MRTSSTHTRFIAALLIAGCTSSSALPSTAPQMVSSVPTGAERDSGAHEAGESDSPFPIEILQGRPLTMPSALRIVAGNQIIDIDTGTAKRIVLDHHEEADFHSFGADGHAIINCFRGCVGEHVFALSRGGSEPRPIGSGSPSPGAGGTWLEKRPTLDNCTLTKVGWDGRAIRPETDFDCAHSLVEETPHGLVAWTPRELMPIGGLILDPNDLSPILESGQILGVTQTDVLYRDGNVFVLRDTESGTEIPIDFPTDIGQPDYGRVSPQGNLLAVPFKHPAWPGPRQRLDVWVLDLEALVWTPIPSMPVAAFLKGIDVQWAEDGRLVLYGAFDEVGTAVATWEPGSASLEVRMLNTDPAGSFVAWCTSDECA